MALRYSGPAALHCDAGTFTVHAVLSTVVASGTYSWGGRLHSPDIAAIRAARQGGTLALPDLDPVEVHVTHTEPHPGGGVQVRVNGHGRAPYERDGEV